MPRNFVTIAKNAFTTHPSEPYEKQKEADQKTYSSFLDQIQSEINNRKSNIKNFQKAIELSVSPEFLQTLTQNPDYIALENSYSDKVATLQAHLDTLIEIANLQLVISSDTLEMYKNMLDGTSSDIKLKADNTFQSLDQVMSDLSNCFANALLESKKNNKFYLTMTEIRSALLHDFNDAGAQNNQQFATDLTTKLTSIIRDKSLPKQLSDPLIDIFEKATFSQNTALVLAALSETIKLVESAQTRANQIINNKQLSLTNYIANLAYELSNEYYLARFSKVYEEIKTIDESNQQLLVDIRAQLTALEAHAPHCKALQELVSDYRKQLHSLQSYVINRPTLDNHVELTTQLEEFKNNLKTGAYFKTIQEKAVVSLTNLQRSAKEQLQQASRYAHEKFWPSCPQN